MKPALMLAFTVLLMGAATALDLSSVTEEERQIVAALSRSGATPKHAENAILFWRQADPALKARVRAAPEDRRWPVILCYFLGFETGSTGRTDPARCEDTLYADSERGRDSWSPDGQWLGPSPECRARNKRNGYGQLECG